METVPDSYTLTMKYNVRFQGGTCPDKFVLFIKNGGLAATIDINMRNIGKTVHARYLGHYNK